jgi:ribosomal protein S18 acetylase RimI-like enzyme
MEEAARARPGAGAGLRLRPLAPNDLEAVAAIDATLSGRPRRSYFERRLAAALRQPELHLQFAAEHQGRVCGYALGRVLEGEFGRTQPALRLEIIGVKSSLRSQGIGRALHAALEQQTAKRGIREFRTAASWRDHGMLRFLDGMGYALSDSLVLDCPVRPGHYGAAEEQPVDTLQRAAAGDANDYGAPAANDYESLARDAADVRSLSQADLEDLIRIDRHFTGEERRGYMQKALDEALLDSAIRISLSARRDGVLAGYLMARADLGDFGRTEPVAVIDAVGVDPGFARQGLGRALLSQLLVNLGALRIERVETVVAKENFPLLGFFYHAGFAPAQRLAFVRPLG